MYITNYKDIEFIGTKGHHPILHEWYDNLAENEVKASVRKIKYREFKPYDSDSFQLVILCAHPFADESTAVERAKGSDNEAAIDRALGALLKAFTHWITHSNVPDEAFVDNRHAVINWWPIEMLQYGFNEPSPQVQAQMEMNYHAMDCLELIRIVTTSNTEFLKLWEGSNDPFLAAGRLAYGRFEWIRQFPEDFISNDLDRDALLERIGEFARDYLGLCRFASISGHDCPLTKKISAVFDRFQRQYPFNIPSWQALAQRHLDGTVDTCISSPILQSREYNEVDSVCDLLRSDLIEATQGMEEMIPAMVNSFLTTLKAPESAYFFTNDIDG